MKSRVGLVAALLLWDAFSWCLALTCYWGAARAAIGVDVWMAGRCLPPLAWALCALAFVLALTAEIAVLHRLFPKPRAGKHRVATSIGFWAQMLNMTLSRTLFLGLLRPLFHSTSLLRYLGYRALGARIDFTVSTSSDALILDPAMVTIGAGATLGARSLVSGHYFKDGCVVMAPVVIENNVLLGLEVSCAPGVRVGAGALILPYAKIGQYARVGANAVVGTEAFVDHGAVVADGEHVAPRTMVARAPKNP